MNEFVTTLRIVSLNDQGFPDAEATPVVGDLYLAPNRTDPETYDQWIWAGDSLGWQRLNAIPVYDDERVMRQQRVEKVKQYFRERKDAETVLSKPTYDYKQFG